MGSLWVLVDDVIDIVVLFVLLGIPIAMTLAMLSQVG